jgi:hypothetical protein
MPLLFAPAIAGAVGLMGIALTHQLFHFIINHGFHHQNPCLGGGLLNGRGHIQHQITHRQDHLKAGFTRGHLDLHLVRVETVHFSSGTSALFRVRFTHLAVS